MKTACYSLLCIIIFLFICSTSALSQNGKLAELIDLDFACSGAEGAAEFRLLGENSELYTYYWSNGETSLRAENLDAGRYTFVVIDDRGCVERHDVSTVPLGCQISSSYEFVDECMLKITIVVTTADGTTVPESGLDIVWSGSNTLEGGFSHDTKLERYFYLWTSSPIPNPCVTVSLLNNDEDV